MKAIVITGVSRGIGKALFELFAQKGYFVYGLTRNVEHSTSLPNTKLIACDIRKRGNVITAIEMICAAGKHIAALINNAGVGYRKSVAEESYEEIIDTFDTNLLGAIYCTKELLPLFQKQQDGVIINISSNHVHKALANRSDYCASKIALNMYMDCLREELRNDHIAVVNIAPGMVNTPMREEDEIKELAGNMLDPYDLAKMIFEIFTSAQAGIVTENITIKK